MNSEPWEAQQECGGDGAPWGEPGPSALMLLGHGAGPSSQALSWHPGGPGPAPTLHPRTPATWHKLGDVQAPCLWWPRRDRKGIFHLLRWGGCPCLESRLNPETSASC